MERSNFACCCSGLTFSGRGAGLRGGDNIGGRTGTRLVGRCLIFQVRRQPWLWLFRRPPGALCTLGFFVSLGLFYALLMELKALAGMV